MPDLTKAQKKALYAKAKKHGEPFANGVTRFLDAFHSKRFEGRFWDFIFSEALGSGRQTLVLSPEECEEFAATAPAFDCPDYHQPFRTMVVEVPPEYAATRPLAETGEYPERIISHFDAINWFLFIFFDMQEHSGCFRIPLDPAELVSESIFKVLTEEAGCAPEHVDMQQMRYIHIAVNAMVATKTRPWSKMPPTDEQTTLTNSVKAKTKGSDLNAYRAKLQLAALPTFYQFDQDTKPSDLGVVVPGSSDDVAEKS